MTQLDRKTIISGLDKLVSGGFIKDTGQRVGFTKQIPVYELNSPKNGTVPKTEANSPVFPIKQSRFSVKQSRKRDTEPSVTVSEPSGERASPRFPRDFKILIDSAKEEQDRIKNRGANIDAFGVAWHNETLRLEFVSLSTKIKEWRKQLLSIKL